MSSTAHSPSKDKNLRAGDDEASSLLKRDSGAAADQSSSTTQPSPSITPPTMENPQGATPSPAVPKSTPKSTVIAQAPAPDPNAFIIAEV